MYELNMAFNVIISALIVIQSALCLPFNTLLFRIDNSASVFESGDDMYTVMWSTSLPGTGYVTYTYEGEEHTVKDLHNASLRTQESIHSVRIPKEHLDNNTYTCHSQYVGTRRAYVAIKGRTVSTKPVKFRGYSGQDKINVLVLSDIHENPGNAAKAVGCFENEPDLLVMNGDEVSFMTAAYKFKQVLSYAHRFSGGSIPVVYTNGNHENRGEFAGDYIDLFKTTTGGLYYTCRYGPIEFLCLDSGEDKKDSDWTYSGLVDYTSYIADETEWLQTVELDEDAQYKVCVVHIPNVKNRYGNNWVDILSDMGIGFLIGGHKHRINFEYNQNGAPFYQMLDGGKSRDNGYVATMLTFADGQINAVCYDNEKNLRGEHTYSFNEEAPSGEAP